MTIKTPESCSLHNWLFALYFKPRFHFALAHTFIEECISGIPCWLAYYCISTRPGKTFFTGWYTKGQDTPHRRRVQLKSYFSKYHPKHYSPVQDCPVGFMGEAAINNELKYMVIRNVYGPEKPHEVKAIFTLLLAEHIHVPIQISI